MTHLPPGYPADAFAAFALLKSRQTLSVEDLQVLAMIECFGEQFYFLLAEGTQHEEAQALLRRNGHEERGHAHRLLQAITLKGGAPFALPDAADNPFMAMAPRELAISSDLIAALEKGEADGDLTYQTWADAEPHAEVAALLRLNGREETRHGERVAAVKLMLQP